jgi:hypothetical protein
LPVRFTLRMTHTHSTRTTSASGRPCKADKVEISNQLARNTGCALRQQSCCRMKSQPFAGTESEHNMRSSLTQVLFGMRHTQAIYSNVSGKMRPTKQTVARAVHVTKSCQLTRSASLGDGCAWRPAMYNYHQRLHMSALSIAATYTQRKACMCRSCMIPQQLTHCSMLCKHW